MTHDAAGPTLEVADLPIAAALVDPGGRIIATSVLFDALIGQDRQGLTGRSLLDLVAPDDRGSLASAWTDSIGARVPVAGRRDDGLPFVATFVVPAGDPSSNRLLVAESRGAPVRSASMPEGSDNDGRGVIDSALSHDVRGALRGVAGFLSIVGRDEALLPEESRGFLDTARRSAATADTMAARLVEYARLGQRPLVVDRVDLSELVAGVVVERGTNEEPPLDVAAEQLAPVVGSRSLLDVLMSELLDNAAKYGATQISVSSRIDGDWLYLRVDDNGPGIDEELRARAFDLFRLLQAKGRYPGVGAGLALVLRIAEVHGGTAWIEAGEHGGTAVIVRLLLA